ncbi:MAG: MFS transporter [Bacteroidales bacterium]|nr:MFS transporter [Bacteroidales bacterium]
MKKLPNFPFKVDKFPVFYGWIIVAAGTIGILVSIPGQTMGVSVFNEPVLKSLGIQRTTLTLAYFLGTSISGLLIIFAGKLYDKYGARVLGMISGLMLGLSLIYLSGIDSRIERLSSVLQNGKTNFLIVTLLTVGFFGIRFFGQGMMTMVSRNMMMKWFVNKRGLVNGISGIFISFGFSIAPFFLNILIEDSSWSTAWNRLGLFSILFFIPFVVFIFRDNPQEVGCLPDNGITSKKDKHRPKFKPLKQYTLGEAVRTYVFWIYAITVCFNALLLTSASYHIVPIFEHVGYSKDIAVKVFIPSAAIAVVFNLLAGILADYIKLKYVLITNIGGMIANCLGFMLLSPEVPFYYHATYIGMGIVWGTFSVLLTITWPRFFGVKHLGAISGLAISMNAIFSAAGPHIFSLSEKFTDSFKSAFIIVTVGCSILFLLAFRADNINEKKE